MPRGVVVDFDEAKGYGSVEDSSTGTRYFFHCTQIADGTRSIPSGADVEFDVGAGRQGRWEAMGLRP
jgi:CspA family cold shock protein